MIIIFSQPFQKMTGVSKHRLSTKEPISLRELLKVLGQEFPAFTHFFQYQKDDSLSAHVMFVRSGRILLLSDWLGRDDQIEIFLPVTGG